MTIYVFMNANLSMFGVYFWYVKRCYWNTYSFVNLSIPWMFQPFNQNAPSMCDNDLTPLFTCCCLTVLRSFVTVYYYWPKWCLLLFIHNQWLDHSPWISYTPPQLDKPWGSGLGSLLLLQEQHNVGTSAHVPCPQYILRKIRTRTLGLV